jgi:hypothetical protein
MLGAYHPSTGGNVPRLITAPFTDGSEKLLPAGLEFVVAADPAPTASAVTAKPEPSDQWEPLLVDKQERTAEKYGGYSLVIPLERLETHCSRR